MFAHPSHKGPFSRIVPEDEGYYGLTFAEAFANGFSIPVENLPEFLFLRSLYPHSAYLSRMIYQVRPEYFLRDFQLIEALCQCERREDFFRHVVHFFNQESEMEVNTWRERLKLRVSGRLLLKEETRLFL
jgi:hypothetical protein